MVISKDAILGDPPVAKARWDLDKLLKGAGPDADPTEIDVSVGIPDAIAGDFLEASADLERNASPTTYTKKKEIRLGRAGAYRIKFDLNSGTAGEIAYGRVYKNGVAVGAEQSNDTTTYVTKSEDIGNWEAGDLCQLYVRRTSTAYINYWRNFRVYTGNPVTNIKTLDI